MSTAPQGSGPQGVGTPGRGNSPDPEHEPPVVRDRRRVRMDGTVTTPEQPDAPVDAPPASAGSGSAAIDRIDQLTGDIDRLTAQLAEKDSEVLRARADFQNYRRRRDREFDAAQTTAVTAFVAALLPVLDDIDRAREHEDMSAGFRSVADGLEQQVAKAGVTRFGEAGDPFDPTVHEALMHGYSEEVTEATATVVVQAGYRVGDRVLRPARVMVMEPPVANAVAESLDTAPGASRTGMPGGDVPDADVPGAQVPDTEGAGVAEGAPLGHLAGDAGAGDTGGGDQGSTPSG